MCAIFGAFNVPMAAQATLLGLHSQQHRACDYVGVVSTDGASMFQRHGEGLACQVLTDDALGKLRGCGAIGHLRYPTVADDPAMRNIQPIMGEYGDYGFALAHNGNVTNVEAVKSGVPSSLLQTSTDSEYIVRLLERVCTGDRIADLSTVMRMLQGSLSLGILFPDCLIAVRGPRGNRPLSIGRANGGYFISSETCAFPNVDAQFVKDVEPGTIAVIDRNGLHEHRFAPHCPQRFCIFEYVYYGHPASTMRGRSISEIRKAIGSALEQRFPVPNADFVMPVPDSSNHIAMGFASSGRSGQYEQGIHRNHYAGRTFIQQTQSKRDVAAARKFVFDEHHIRGRVIVVIDDSIVRFTTLPKIVKKCRALGAKEIHVRIGSPQILHPCIYGIATPTTSELVANRLSLAEILRASGADSLEHLTMADLRSVVSDPDDHCFACMNGDYW